MARLFWVGTGVALTVVVFVKGRRIVRQYAPAALVDKAAAGAQATSDAFAEAASHFLADYRSARDERAATLSESLLAKTQGSVDDLRARRTAAQGGRTAHTHGRHADAGPDGAVDDETDDDLGYSF